MVRATENPVSRPKVSGRPTGFSVALTVFSPSLSKTTARFEGKPTTGVHPHDETAKRTGITKKIVNLPGNTKKKTSVP